MNINSTSDDSNYFNKILNLDDLYEKKKLYDISRIKNYNMILNRIHTRIKITSRQKFNEQYCWYVIPEIIIGVNMFDQGECIAYIIDKLETNGFKLNYTHPNLLFISWKDWVPDYVRDELKKQTGVVIDGYGNIKNQDNNNNLNNVTNINNKHEQKINDKSNVTNINTKAIETYKPSGNLIYNTDMINQTLKKFQLKEN
jgi:hypothetical protein